MTTKQFENLQTGDIVYHIAGSLHLILYSTAKGYFVYNITSESIETIAVPRFVEFL